MKQRLSNTMSAGFVLALLSALPVQAAPDKVCLNLRDIASSQPSKDGASITFHMQDGKLWRNDLASRCPDLQFNGFVWVLHTEQVCDNEESFRVIQSGEVCQLGKFTQMTPVPKS